MLKAALDKFVDDLVAAQKASGKSYRVAVVTFSNNNHDVALWNQYKMTGYYVGSNFIGYKDRDKSYGKALMDVSSA